ncbi:EAL domain-containing protein [Rhizobium sp. S-51]|uniref:EAL domain-containing protein n=1 Tax=Rhizobium terricola TaxID=2728849 RepID=A0A7Y0FYQ9_9HYPH|nr:EAL domain-containing protein [Rhizobium terricola]NML76889.1 EAL domain-containing protein [Rhizobium terricola]
MNGRGETGLRHPDVVTADVGNLSRETLRAEMAKTFRPIIRGFMLPVVLFYTLVIVPNFFLSPLPQALKLSALSGATAVTAFVCRRLLARRDASFARLELIGAVVLLLIYLNCCNILYIAFHQANLVFFLLLFILTAAVAISVRLIVAGCSLALATMLAAAWAMGPETLLYYSFVSIAGAFAATGMAILMRGAIMNAVRARLVADRLRQRAEVQAERDALTGLPNRRHFFSGLERMVVADLSGETAHIGLIDLDGFKAVNDVYGHAVGDQLLVEVSERLREICPEDCLIARLGGDEFGVLVRRPLTAAGLDTLGRAICETLGRPFAVAGRSLTVTGSVGFAHYPTNGRTVGELYERADYALYRAKREHRGSAVVFSARYEAEMRDVSRVKQVLRDSDLEAELYLLFQPQYDIMRNRPVAFEALARWQSAVLGPVTPDVFIVAAERSGLIERVSEILLRKALAAAAVWPQEIGLSFNLSAVDLVSTSAIARLCTIVGESGVAPGRVTFELTETAMMSDFEKARASMEMLASLGCRIALDDFGSGYSSFGYIHRFPLHKIKTDRNFVVRLGEDKAVGFGILRAIIELCANLGVECIVEGVETANEVDTVRAAGARYIQGYHFGRPMTAVAAGDYLDAEMAGEDLKAS